jgi:glyoxylase-like metal-dependent hydrolase (beta-lactamase superfamily II)
MFVDLGKLKPGLAGVGMLTTVGLSSNVYVIGLKSLTLVDSGVGNRANLIAPQLETAKLHLNDVRQVILTHAHHDHTGGLREIHDYSTPTVFVHEADAVYLRAPKLVRLKGGEEITTEVGLLSVLHTPGHSAGSLCLYVPSRRVLFSGDTAFPGGGFGRTDGNSGSSFDMINSLKKLARLKVDVILPGHGDPVTDGAEESLNLSLQEAQEYFRD